MIRTYSFDIFDTCIVRIFANPSDLFFQVVERTLALAHGAESIGTKYDREEISELVLARIAAEKRAQANRQTEDITIYDIYSEFKELEGWGIKAADMLQQEIMLELEAARPVVEIRNRIEALRSNGCSVIFITDMYLPAKVIKQMLIRCGYQVPEHTLYVSNEIGLTKRSGNLYKHILNERGLSNKQLLHCGDGIESDFMGAKKAGVNGQIVTATHLNRFEKAMLKISSSKPTITSKLAGISRVTRLGFKGPGELNGSAEIASSVIAPLLTGFVLWVLQDAKRRGLERLYFVARDGQILHKIASEINKEKEFPEVRYLYGSRQAWYLPSVFSMDRNELEFVLLTGQSSAPRHNLKRLKLTPEEFPDTLEKYGFGPESWDKQIPADQIEAFWNFLEDVAVAPKVLHKATTSRNLALKYFEQEGLLKDDKWAIVDVGWTLRTQGSFKKILHSVGQEHTLGYYLGICKGRFSAVSYGQARGYLLEEEEDAMATNMVSLFQNKGLIDQVFTMADHGSTKGYVEENGKIVPDLGKLPSYPKREAFLSAIQESITHFASEFTSAGLTCHEEELRKCARLVTSMLISDPTKKEARTLAWAPISDDPNELRAAPLAKPLNPLDLLRIGTDVIKRVRQNRSSTSITVPSLFYKDLSWGFSWLEGSAALSPFWGGSALWAFRKLQHIMREKKQLAAKPIVLWQKIFDFKKKF